MVMSIAFIVFLAILAITLGLVTKNLLNKVEKYEDKIVEYQDSIIAFQKYFKALTEAIHLSNEQLNVIDSKGTFKTDDEVGYFFKFLEETQTLLNGFDYTKPVIENPDIKKTK